jgi:hypothetical protein
MGKGPSWPNGAPKMKGRHTKSNQKGGCGDSVTFVAVALLVISLWVAFPH